MKKISVLLLISTLLFACTTKSSTTSVPIPDTNQSLNYQLPKNTQPMKFDSSHLVIGGIYSTMNQKSFDDFILGKEVKYSNKGIELYSVNLITDYPSNIDIDAWIKRDSSKENVQDIENDIFDEKDAYIITYNEGLTNESYEIVLFNVNTKYVTHISCQLYSSKDLKGKTIVKDHCISLADSISITENK